MNSEQISKIWIDNFQRLCIKPIFTDFKMIHRSTMGVHWNEEEHYLYSQVMRSWTPDKWFRQIVAAVEKEYGYRLYITEKTKWENIDESSKESYYEK